MGTVSADMSANVGASTEVGAEASASVSVGVGMGVVLNQCCEGQNDLTTAASQAAGRSHF